jgi:hypothetical protein
MSEVLQVMQTHLLHSRINTNYSAITQSGSARTISIMVNTMYFVGVCAYCHENQQADSVSYGENHLGYNRWYQQNSEQCQVRVSR